MADKEHRQRAIVRLIRRERVRTQTKLIGFLHGEGVEVDQSTLSRDLAELRIRKTGGCYVQRATESDDQMEDAGATAVRWFTTCGPHQIVMRTRIGQAQPVALTIDQKADSSILATLAGDDTVLVATKTARAQTVALRRLKDWFGDQYER